MAIKTYSLKKNGNLRLSKNFTVKEFASHDGADAIYIDSELVKLLQNIRDHFGKALTISSGYRSAEYNASVGGSRSSTGLLWTG